jgi:hypothetical protein
MKALALCIGIDYNGQTDALYGCNTDAVMMGEYAASVGYEQVRVRTDQASPHAVTGQNLVMDLCRLVLESHEYKLEKVLFYFSGHGIYMPDSSGDEQDAGEIGYDEGILPVDFHRYGAITDDVLRSIFTLFYPATTVLCIFDCCYSGTICDLNRSDPGRMMVLSACGQTQVARELLIDGSHHGLFTYVLLLLLRRTQRPLEETFHHVQNVLQTYGQDPKLVTTDAWSAAENVEGSEQASVASAAVIATSEGLEVLVEDAVEAADRLM